MIVPVGLCSTGATGLALGSDTCRRVARIHAPALPNVDAAIASMRATPPVAERGELLRARASRQVTAVLAQEVEQQVDGSLRHVDELFDVRSEGVVVAQEGRFGEEVFVDGLLDAGVEGRRVASRVEEAVVVAGVVHDVDVERRRRAPSDDGEEALRVALEHGSVRIHPLQDGGRYGEHDAGWREAVAREDVVDEVTVDAAVAVLEGMDGGEAESDDGGGDDGIECARGPALAFDEALYEAREVVGSGS